MRAREYDQGPKISEINDCTFPRTYLDTRLDIKLMYPRNDTEIEHKTKDKGYYLSLTFTSSLKGYRFHKNAKEIKQVSKINKEF